MIILETIKGIHSTGITLNKILSRMKELAKLLPEYDVVLNMNGVGERLAPRIIAEIGDVRKYYSAKALVAYSGIDAPPYQSGNFNGNNRKISKRGSRYLRKTGYEIMKSIKCRVPTKDTAVYDYIIKKESEGKAKKQAKIAGLNKFLRIYYARVSEILKN
ncbi:transposase [Clostridium sp. CT7]|uniref:transposase n=2 Tax=Clostridiaceae TaxID=31979 RepID=UPI00325AD0D8